MSPAPHPEATKEAAPWVADFEARLAAQELQGRRARWWRLVGVGVGQLLLIDAILSVLLLPLMFLSSVAEEVFPPPSDWLTILPQAVVFAYGALRVLMFMLPFALPPWALALVWSALRARLR